MKQFLMALSVLLFTASFTYAQESCEGAKIGKNATDLVWSHSEAIGKMVIVKNLDTNLVYPKDVSYKTQGNISLKDLLPNKKGYTLILADLTEESLKDVKVSIQNCLEKKDCSMNPKKLQTKKTPCSWLEFNLK